MVAALVPEVGEDLPGLSTFRVSALRLRCWLDGTPLFLELHQMTFRSDQELLSILDLFVQRHSLCELSGFLECCSKTIHLWTLAVAHCFQSPF